MSTSPHSICNDVDLSSEDVLTRSEYMPIEWNTPDPPPIDLMASLSDGYSNNSKKIPRCYNLLNLVDCRGLSFAVRNGKTIGLFSHVGRLDEVGFNCFASRLKTVFPGSNLGFSYFHLQQYERIDAVGVRYLKDATFPFCSPVLEVMHHLLPRWHF